MPLAVGSRLGPYEIHAMVGAGGMGQVYRAYDIRLRRTVAIKILPPDKVADTDRRNRFFQEARAASAVIHPNIVVLLDIASESGMDFLVMEYVAGETLSKRIKDGLLPVGQVVSYGKQIASAPGSRTQSRSDSSRHQAGQHHGDSRLTD